MFGPGPRCIALICLGLLMGCTYPLRNLPATPQTASHAYSWKNLPADDLSDTLVIVTASGGGTRAATLATAVFRTLDKIDLPNGKSLAREIDILSSVSGGSVAAAYFALHGTDGLDDFERNFLRQDGIAAILQAGLNPIGLAKLSLPSKERIDLLIDYLDDQLFQGKTFADLAAARRRPYLILNAADMVEGVPFPFTQYQLDAICSDLAKIKLSTAVAASAAFPIALSPVTLRNYSPCGATRRPGWIDQALDADWQTNPSRMAYGRVADAYAKGQKAYIHLLDGGIVDNLGVSEPYRLLTNADVSPLLLTQIETGQIKKIVFVMINARSFKPSPLDQQEATPGIVDMLMATINASIDQTTAGTAGRLRDLLDKGWLEAGAQATVSAKQNLQQAAAHAQYLAVDFDAIPDDACRRLFHSIPTSWTLTDQENDAVLAMGAALINDSPALAGLKTTMNAQLSSDWSAEHIADVCAHYGPYLSKELSLN